MKKHFSLLSFVAGFMLGALCIGAIGTGPELLVPLSATPSPTEVAAHKAVAESGAISVADQPAGSSVAVESVTVPPPGVWVAVREVSGADLGNVLGAIRVNGPRTAVTIPLLRATESGLTYAVELYRDDGNGRFSLPEDSVYVDFETGNPVISYFTTN